MPTTTRTPSLGVDWHLPNKDGSFAKRRFATTTVATAFLVEMLADEGLTWRELRDAILYDGEARAIAEAFVDAGHGDVLARQFLTARDGLSQR